MATNDRVRDLQKLTLQLKDFHVVLDRIDSIYKGSSEKPSEQVSVTFDVVSQKGMFRQSVAISSSLPEGFHITTLQSTYFDHALGIWLRRSVVDNQGSGKRGILHVTASQAVDLSGKSIFSAQVGMVSAYDVGGMRAPFWMDPECAEKIKVTDLSEGGFSLCYALGAKSDTIIAVVYPSKGWFPCRMEKRDFQGVLLEESDVVATTSVDGIVVPKEVRYGAYELLSDGTRAARTKRTVALHVTTLAPALQLSDFKVALGERTEAVDNGVDEYTGFSLDPREVSDMGSMIVAGVSAPYSTRKGTTQGELAGHPNVTSNAAAIGVKTAPSLWSVTGRTLLAAAVIGIATWLILAIVLRRDGLHSAVKRSRREGG